MIYPEEYVAWDLETSGLDASKDRILEIGMMHVRRGVTLESRNWILKQDIKVSDLIINLTGITQEMVDAGVDVNSALVEFMQCLEGVNYANLTHNGFRFDHAFLNQAMFNSRMMTIGDLKVLEGKIRHGAFDTAALYKARKLNMHRMYNEDFATWADRVLATKVVGLKYNVAHCCSELGIDVSGVTMHRALADVELTNKIFQKLYEARKGS